MKKPLEIVQNWSRWCPIHNGVPLPFDLNGYVCHKCGKTVCVSCIYKTEKGFLCANCIKKEKPTIIEPLISKSETLKNHKWYLKIAIITSIFSIILALTSTIIEIELLIFPAIFFFVITILILFISIIIVIKENHYESKTKLSKEKIENLDQEILNTKD